MVDAAHFSPSDVEEDRQRSSRADRTRSDGFAVAGESTCPHPAGATVALGIGAPLTFERCGRCGAVLVGRLGGRAE